MQSVREVYSLLMPIKDGRMVIPRAAVAEVMGYSKPKERPENAPDFLLGFVEWQGQRIPLVSFEAARGLGVPELGRRTRIAVVFGIAGRLTPDVFAVVTQGYPYLVRVNENVLQREEMSGEDPLILARVRMANEKPYIPDLEELEKRIADGLGLAPGEPAPTDSGPVDELDELGALAGGEEEFEAGLLDAGDEPPETGRPPEGADTGDDPFSTAGDEKDASESGDFDVTGFGSGDYSVELGELSAALEDEGGGEAGEPAEPAGDDDYRIDFDGLELGEDPGTENAENDDAAVDLSGLTLEEEDTDGKAGEFDLSDLEIDLDDDDEKKD